MSDAPLLEVRGLEVRFAARKGAVVRAVDGVDLAVREGEVLALVGEFVYTERYSLTIVVIRTVIR